MPDLNTMNPIKTCRTCHTHWSDCDVLDDGVCAKCLRAEVVECRTLLREACDSIDRAIERFDDGKFYLASFPDFLKRDWQERAIIQAAKGGGE